MGQLSLWDAAPPTKRRGKPRICEVCLLEYQPTHQAQRSCSRACGLIIRFGHSATVVPWAQCRHCDSWYVQHHKAVFCSGRCRRAVYLAERSYGDIRTKACVTCGNSFTYEVNDGGPPKFCSDRCRAIRRRSVKIVVGKKQRQRFGSSHGSRARHYGVPHEPIELHRIYERDEWICQLCGEPIDRMAAAPHDWSPSIDHIIPLSHPGSPGHVATNLQAAHFWCNSVKGDRADFNWESCG